MSLSKNGRGIARPGEAIHVNLLNRYKADVGTLIRRTKYSRYQVVGLSIGRYLVQLKQMQHRVCGLHRPVDLKLAEAGPSVHPDPDCL